VVADMTAPSDLSMKPGPSCGQTVMCIFGCAQDITCDQMCIQGVQPKAIGEALTLALCAAQNCLMGGDGGFGGGLTGGNMTALFLCLGQNCSKQIAGCEGLFGTP
jgi:hypothetical protein